MPDTAARFEAVKAWNVLPDFASVNFSEQGAGELVRLLLSKDVGVGAGLCDAAATEVFLESGLASRCICVLIEPQQQELKSAVQTVKAVEKILKSGPAQLPTLLHGTEATVWPMMDEAISRGYDIRIGLEDTIILPDGVLAQNNVELAMEAKRRARVAKRGTRVGGRELTVR